MVCLCKACLPMLVLTQLYMPMQEAAGLFGHLKDVEANKTDAPRPTDISAECVVMLEKLMLTQAQVCESDHTST